MLGDGVADSGEEARGDVAGDATVVFDLGNVVGLILLHPRHVVVLEFVVVEVAEEDEGEAGGTGRDASERGGERGAGGGEGGRLEKVAAGEGHGGGADGVARKKENPLLAESKRVIKWCPRGVLISPMDHGAIKGKRRLRWGWFVCFRLRKNCARPIRERNSLVRRDQRPGYFQIPSFRRIGATLEIGKSLYNKCLGLLITCKYPLIGYSWPMNSKTFMETLLPKTVMEILKYKNRAAFWQMADREGMPRIRISSRKVLVPAAEFSSWLAKRRTTGGCG